MTKKDYILISDVFCTANQIWKYALKQYQRENTPEAKEEVEGISHIINATAVLVEGLCEKLSEDNPRFDRERFIQACNSEEIINS